MFVTSDSLHFYIRLKHGPAYDDESVVCIPRIPILGFFKKWLKCLMIVLHSTQTLAVLVPFCFHFELTTSISFGNCEMTSCVLSAIDHIMEYYFRRQYHTSPFSQSLLAQNYARMLRNMRECSQVARRTDMFTQNRKLPEVSLYRGWEL